MVIYPCTEVGMNPPLLWQHVCAPVGVALQLQESPQVSYLPCRGLPLAASPQGHVPFIGTGTSCPGWSPATSPVGTSAGERAPIPQASLTPGPPQLPQPSAHHTAGSGVQPGTWVAGSDNITPKKLPGSYLSIVQVVNWRPWVAARRA